MGTPEVGAGSTTEARNDRGFDPDGVAETEADHFGNCPVCGALVDMRDLGRILALIGALSVLKGGALMSLPHSVRDAG